MKKILFVLNILLIPFFLSGVRAQCSCDYFYSLQSASYYANNDFNCFMYVKAYFATSQTGIWIPPSYFVWTPYSISSIAQDPNFEEVTDPEQANVVLYTCDHAAIVVPGTNCLVSKNNFNGDIFKHGVNGIGCGNDGLRLFRYVNSASYTLGVDSNCLFAAPPPPPPPPPICNVPCTIEGVNTFNYTSVYYNSVDVSCSNATSFTWTKTNGNSPYYWCDSYDCASFSFYLNNGASVTFNIKAYSACGTQIGSKNATFYRTGGYYRAVSSSGALQEKSADKSFVGSDKAVEPRQDAGIMELPIFWVYPNPANDRLQVKMEKGLSGILTLTNLTGQEVYRRTIENDTNDYIIDLNNTQPGFHILSIKDDQGATLFIDKVMVEK
jgi:Secretion system C-terminal sorting domain